MLKFKAPMNISCIPRTLDLSFEFNLLIKTRYEFHLRVVPKNSPSLDQGKKKKNPAKAQQIQSVNRSSSICLSATTYTRRYLLIKTRRYPKSDREFASASMSTTFTSYPSSLSGPRSSDVPTTTNALDFICGTCPLSSNKSLLKRTPQPEIHSFPTVSPFENPARSRCRLKMPPSPVNLAHDSSRF